MGMYVYRVTKEHMVIGENKWIQGQVAKFAYKPTYHGQQVGDKYLSAEQINNKWAFKSGCMARTVIDTDYIILLSKDGKDATVYRNPNKMRTFYDDVTLGSDMMPYYNSYETSEDGYWVASEPEVWPTRGKVVENARLSSAW
jgi:hypothetical protein